MSHVGYLAKSPGLGHNATIGVHRGDGEVNHVSLRAKMGH
jgi:hypothetical protein